jgi:hypothetical protein
MTLDEEVDFFFAAPLPEQTGSVRSTLHLLRREMQDCLIGTVVPENEFAAYPGERHRLFATLMVIMSGIDLLAKFYAGNDKSGCVGDRFKAFAMTFLFSEARSPEQCADVLYHCRNTVMHSFNVREKRKQYKVNIVDKASTEVVWPVPGQPNRFVISVEGLAQAFIKAIESYESAVRADSQLQLKFTNMFFDYGDIGVQIVIADKVTR